MSENGYRPDFSGDDFANDKEIQKNRKALKLYEQMLDDSLDLVKQELNARKDSHANLKDFLMYKSLGATIRVTLKASILNKELRVALAEYYSAAPTAKSHNSGTDQYLFGCLALKNSFPRTYVHKETIKEKIEDVFLKREVDFPHSKKFSRKFQVLTSDKYQLERLLQFANLNELAIFPNMELELFNNKALFRCSRTAISLKEAAIFCKLAKTLLNIFE